MKDFPTDPMRQHARFFAAFCDDLSDMCLNGGTGTPHADRVMEITRQINSTPREAGSAQEAPARNHG
jgi:hypothetical protein